MMRRTFKIWFNYKPIFKLAWSFYNELTSLVASFRGICDEVVEEYKERNVKDCENVEDPKKTLIHLLTDPKNNLSDREINDEILTFIVAVSNKNKIN